MGWWGDFKNAVLGPGQEQYDGLTKKVYNPNAGAYSNTQSDTALAGLRNVNEDTRSLGAQGYGNGGLAAQQSALDAITQMSQGKGPSLAAANLNAGLNNTFNNLSAQAMTNQGNTGTGSSQRNLLNAQANAANQVSQQAGIASVAEQLGAQQQRVGAAQGVTDSQLAQGNFQRGLLQDRRQGTMDQYDVGQQDVQNAMRLDAAKKAASDQRLAIENQGINAAHTQFSNALDTVGKVVNIGASIGSTIATGGLNQVAGAAMGAGKGLASGGGQGMAQASGYGPDTTDSMYQLDQRARAASGLPSAYY